VQEVLHEPFKQDTCKPNSAQINNWNKVLSLLDKPLCRLLILVGFFGAQEVQRKTGEHLPAGTLRL
jgi:hypothetical protein